MSRHDLSDADQYRNFLTVMVRGFAPVEDWLAAHWRNAPDGASFARRAPLIAADRSALEACDEPTLARFQPDGSGTAEILGVLYVLEGSRLGGKLLKRRVSPGLPTHFLDDSEPVLAWRTLLQRIEALSPEDLDRASKSATATFGFFLDAASA